MDNPLQEFFDKRSLTPLQEQEVMDALTSRIEASPKATQEKKRDILRMREDLMESRIDQLAEANQKAGPEELAANRETIIALRQRKDKMGTERFVDALRGLASLAPKTGEIAKKGFRELEGITQAWNQSSERYDPMAFSAGAGRGLAEGSLRDTATGRHEPGETFFGALEKWNQRDENIKKDAAYREAVKQNPTLAEWVKAGVVDGAFGTVFAPFRAASALKWATRMTPLMEVAGQTVSKGGMVTRAAAAPIVGNIAAGQGIYAGLEAVDKALADSELAPEVKQGIRISALIGGAIFMGIPQAGFEKMIAGSAKMQQAFREAAEVVAHNASAGVDLRELILASDMIPEHKAIVLGDSPLVQNMNKTGGLPSPTAMSPAEAKAQLGPLSSQAVEPVQLADGTLVPPGWSPEASAVPEEVRKVRRSELGEAPEWMIGEGPSNLPEPTVVPESRRALEGLEYLEEYRQQLLQAAEGGEDVTTKLAEVEAQMNDFRKLLAMDNPEFLGNLIDRELTANKQVGQSVMEGERKAKLTALRDLLEVRKQALEAEGKQSVLNRVRDRERIGELTSQERYPSATIENVGERVGSLPLTEQERISKIAQASSDGAEMLLGRKLTPKERTQNLTDIYNRNRRAWSDNPYPTADKPVVTFGDSQFAAAGYVADKYPLLERTLAVVYPDMAKIGVYTPDQVLAFCQGGTFNSGLMSMPEEYLLRRDVLYEGYQLWDDIREGLPKGDGKSLRQFLRSPELSKQILDSFPEMDVAFRVGSLPANTEASADILERVITVGADGVELNKLLHDLGHINFWYGLDADRRIGWLDRMRGWAKDLDSWADNFPNFDQRMSATNQILDETQRKAQQAWLFNPSEMYAEQWAAYAGAGKLPSPETIGSFTRLIRGMKQFLGAAKGDWENLPPDTRRFMTRIQHQPDPASLREVPSGNVEEVMRANWLFKEGEAAQGRIAEIETELGIKYPQLDVTQPVWVQVSVEDLPGVMEAEALKVLNDLPGASPQALRDGMARLEEELADKNRVGLLDRMVEQVSPGASQGVQALRLSPTARRAIAEDAKYKGIRELTARMRAAEGILQDEGITNYTRDDVRALAEQLTPDGEGGFWKEAVKVERTPYEEVTRRLAEIDVDHENLQNFISLVMDSKGVNKMIDPIFTTRLSMAERLASFAGQPWTSKITPGYTAAQMAKLAFSASFGVTQDEDGWHFSVDKWASTPAAWLMVPGGFEILQRIPKWGKTVAGKALDKYRSMLTPEAAGDFDRTLKRFKTGATELRVALRGFKGDLQDIKRNAELQAIREKNSFYSFAEVIYHHFTPTQREQITRFIENRPEDAAEIAAIAQNSPEIVRAAKMTQDLYASIEKTLKDLGLVAQNAKLISPTYINRVYDDVAAGRMPAILMQYNIDPLHLGYLKGRGVNHSIDNKIVMPSALTQLLGGPMRLLEKSARNEGLALDIGTKLNMYSDGNNRYFAVAGSNLDKQLASYGLVEDGANWNKGEQGWTIQDINGRSYKVNRDMTKKEMTNAKVSYDVCTRIARMGEMMEKDIRKGYALKALAEDTSGLYVSPNKVDGWFYVEPTIDRKLGTAKYGQLAGKWISPEAHLMLMTLDADWMQRIGKWTQYYAPPLYWLGKGLGKALNLWKINKTVLTPIAHMNNFVSNLFMGYLQGHNPLRELQHGYKMIGIRNQYNKIRGLKAEGKLQEAAQLEQTIQGDPYYKWFQEVLQARMYDSSIWSVEMNSHDFLRDFRLSQKSGRTFESDTLEGLLDAAGKYMVKASDWAVRKPLGVAGRLYEQEDLIFKMGAFVAKRMEQDKLGIAPNVDDAVRYAYQAYFDYGNLSQGAKFLRDTGLAPFISYTYNALPALLRAFSEHPGRVALLGLLLEGINLYGVGQSYGFDKAWQKKEAIDKASPHWLATRGALGFRNNIQLPFGTYKGEKGTVNRTLNLRYMMPSGDLLTTQEKDNPLKFKGGRLGGFLTQFQALLNLNPAHQSLITAYTGKNAFTHADIATGGKLENDEVVSDRNQSKLIDILLASSLPNNLATPGSTSFDKFVNALVAQGILPKDTLGKTGLDYDGNPYGIGKAVADQIGIKLVDTNLERQIKQENKTQKRELGKERSWVRRQNPLRNPTLTQEHFEEARQKFREVTKPHYLEKRQQRNDLLATIREMNRQRESGGQSLPK